MVVADYIVLTRKKAIKKIEKMPAAEREKLIELVKDLEKDGPEQHSWLNYSKLGKKQFHCHLSYKWVACWQLISDDIIEVYYAGSRENAPY